MKYAQNSQIAIWSEYSLQRDHSRLPSEVSKNALYSYLMSAVGRLYNLRHAERSRSISGIGYFGFWPDESNFFSSFLDVEELFFAGGLSGANLDGVLFADFGLLFS